MAQKKITDLQLRSDFDETCNLPVDDASQTWRTTGQQILDFITGNLSVSRSMLAAGALGKMIVQTKTTTYTAENTDDVILCSGSAFTVSLPTAVSNAGKFFLIKKTDTSLTNIITIDGNGSETIDGALTTTLNTFGETILIVSDGANWQVLKRVIPSVWVSYSPASNCTTNCTVTGRWRRTGDSIQLEVGWSFSGENTQNIAIEFDLPSGLAIDTTKLAVTPGTASHLFGVLSALKSGTGSFPGGFGYSDSNSLTVRMHTIIAGALYIGEFRPATATPFTPGNGDVIAGTVFSLPISGWNS